MRKFYVPSDRQQTKSWIHQIYDPWFHCSVYQQRLKQLAWEGSPHVLQLTHHIVKACSRIRPDHEHPAINWSFMKIEASSSLTYVTWRSSSWIKFSGIETSYKWSHTWWESARPAAKAAPKAFCVSGGLLKKHFIAAVRRCNLTCQRTKSQLYIIWPCT